MFAVSQIRHLLGSAFGSVSHRPLDAFPTGNTHDEDDEEHDVANNSVTNKASQTFTKLPLHRIANEN